MSNPQDIYNALFDPEIEELCIDYIKNKCNNNDFINKLVLIQEDLDQIEELEKNYVIRDNYYVFEKLLNNSLIKEELSNFFVKKYIIIFNYKKNGSTNYDDLKFIQKIKSKLTDNLDFEYHFFNFILERFNNFILEKQNSIFEHYKNEYSINYYILNKIFEKLYNTYYDNINDDFICPISLNLMNEAVKTIYGHNFDKIELIEWLNKNSTCPMTRLELTIDDFEIDVDMNNKINEWKKNNKKQFTTICCNENLDIKNFEEYFYKNSFDNKELKGFNYKIKCMYCKNEIFNYL